MYCCGIFFFFVKFLNELLESTRWFSIGCIQKVEIFISRANSNVIVDTFSSVLKFLSKLLRKFCVRPRWSIEKVQKNLIQQSLQNIIRQKIGLTKKGDPQLVSGDELNNVMVQVNINLGGRSDNKIKEVELYFDGP